MFTIVYLLLVFVFGGVFASVQVIERNAFGETGTQASFYDFQYFSLMTMTTLGYSDLQPVTPWAKAVVSAEAVLGMSWLLWGVVLVGWYVEEELRNTVAAQAAGDKPAAQGKPNGMAAAHGVDAVALQAELTAMRGDMALLRATMERSQQQLQTAVRDGRDEEGAYFSNRASVPQN